MDLAAVEDDDALAGGDAVEQDQLVSGGSGAGEAEAPSKPEGNMTGEGAV